MEKNLIFNDLSKNLRRTETQNLKIYLQETLMFLFEKTEIVANFELNYNMQIDDDIIEQMEIYKYLQDKKMLFT